MIRMKMAADHSALAELQYHLAKLGQKSAPATSHALKAGANLIYDTWHGFALGGSLTGVESLKNPNDGYARSIRNKQTSDFSHEIYSESIAAERIEDGTQEHDMKTTHPYGKRSRVSKKGIPYLIIPFRWGTPGKEGDTRVGFKNVMPINIYNVMKNTKKIKKSKALNSTHNESNFKGQPQERREYEWGGRLKFGMSDDITPNMEGMTRMTGRAGYFTFRVISANSPSGSWIRPAVAARPVTKAIADNTQRTIEAIVEMGIMEDLEL